MSDSAVAAVVFDLDGVLVNSEPVWDAAKHEVTERAGGRWRESAGTEMLGMSGPEWAEFMRTELEIPLPADEICETLGVARSNVSNSIKELQGWGLVRPVHVFGDRREHFETLRDVWEMFLIILRERKKRELDPTVQTLRECAAEAAKTKEGGDHTVQRLNELIEFMELSGSWAEKAQALSPTAAKRLCRLGDKVFRLVG